ncbi:MAG: hypothetical protein M3P52_02905 [Actinomycetota bacterium]|nr:hypothetical protein [Actinomycetota bacterium]
MTDPLPPSTADRLAALRQPAEKRRKPAHTSKILTAGLSTTALLGLVTAMGWQTGSAQTTTLPEPAIQSATPVAPVVPVVPVVPVMPALATVPTTAAPVAVPAPVVIPVAVPVAQVPVQISGGAASNTTTKASG